MFQRVVFGGMLPVVAGKILLPDREKGCFFDYVASCGRQKKVDLRKARWRECNVASYGRILHEGIRFGEKSNRSVFGWRC